MDVLALERGLRDERPRFVDALRDIVSIDGGTPRTAILAGLIARGGEGVA